MTVLFKNIQKHIALLVAFFICDLTISSEVQWQDVSSMRLPTSVQPTKYVLHITSNIHENTSVISGNVVIDLHVFETTNEIVLHAKELHDIVVSLIDLRNGRRYEDIQHSLDKQKDFLKISSPKRLQNGERYRLEILFIGSILEEFYGIYRSSYVDENNKTIPLAITQFEPTGARLAFPCFDEPAFKAKFVISITHSRRYIALSNMPVDGQPSLNGDMLTTHFRETPKMPTHLVAFVICDFESVSELVNGIQHRVFFPPNAKDKGSRALTNSIQSVTVLEELLGIEYPLPKLDHIHVKDTNMVAMENWGLIVYDDNEFLTTLEDRESTVKRIVLQNYEISQQWFANMVTIKWWSSAWLKTGLGTYYSIKLTDLMYPTWKIEEYFILTDVDELFKNILTRPLGRKVETEADIQDLTSDNTTYQMGACIIKMFAHAIGDKTFTKAIVTYLNKNKYYVADENDFFGALHSAIRDDYLNIFQNEKYLSRIMKSWTNNQGIPTVKVTRNYNNETVTIQQRSNSGKVDEKWWIPLNFATQSNGNFTRTTADFIMPPQTEVTIDLEDINVTLMDKDWLIVNKQQTGMYYVIYDDKNLELISETLNKDHSQIHMLNRALLFRDLKAILDTDLGAIEPLLNSLKYLKKEKDSMPWFRAAELINDLRSRLDDGKASEPFRKFIHDIITDFYHSFFELPLYKLSFADSIIKNHIYKLACEVGLNECLGHARNQSKEYLYYGWPIDVTSKKFTMCKTMESAPPEELVDILEKILYPSVKAKQQTEFIMSLRCVTSEENLKIILDFVSYGERHYLKKLISDYIYKENPLYRKVVLQDVKDKTKEIKDLFKKGQKRDLSSKSEETIRKHKEFRRKYEDFIYAWLINYELEKEAIISEQKFKAKFNTNYRRF